MTRKALIAGLALAGLAAGAAQARDDLRQGVHVLSTEQTRAFAEVVARGYAERSGQPAPIIETVGIDETVRRFCAGLGLEAPDMMLVSSTMDASARAACMTNGVTRIAEIKLGYEALVLANKADAPAFDLTPRQIYLAVARQVPRGGELVANPYRRWKEIDSRLPDLPIRIIGPAADSDMAESFRQHFLRQGCLQAGLPNRLSAGQAAAACRELRSDGVYREASTPDFRDAVATLREDGVPLAILPLSVVQQRGRGLATNAVDGVLPTEAAIAFGEYPAGTPIHLYVKLEQAGRVAGLTDLARAIAAQGLTGPDGELIQQGLVPLPYRDQIHQQIKANGMTSH